MTYNFFSSDNGGRGPAVAGFISDTVFDPQVYPTAFPLEIANSLTMSVGRLMWRVRGVAVATDGVTNAGASSVAIFNGNMTDIQSKSTESDILTILNGTQIYTTDGTVQLGIFSGTNDASGAQIYYSSGVWRPQLSLFGQVAAADGPDFASISVSTAEINLPFPATRTMTGNIFGVSTTLYVSEATTGAGTTNLTFLNITANSFWSWGGRYDTSTGLEL